MTAHVSALTSHCTRLNPSLPNGVGSDTHHAAHSDPRAVVMLDIDNTLYSKKTRINDTMQDLIQKFFEKLGLSQHEANELHSRYYRQYGLSIRGLIKHHAVDPLVYNEECDGAIPLEQILSPDAGLRKLLERIDRSKTRLWALTNAYKLHAERVLRILGVEDLFEAIISCDYAHPTFRCKPEAEYFAEALQHAGAQPDDVYFVDDSALNVAGAREVGWTKSVLFDEDGAEARKPVARDIPGQMIIASLEELPRLWPEVFTSARGS